MPLATWGGKKSQFPHKIKAEFISLHLIIILDLFVFLLILKIHWKILFLDLT